MIENPLIAELRDWIEKNRNRLASHDATIIDKLPKVHDNDQSGGAIGLSRNHILISFLTWDWRPLRADLLVYDTRTDKTVMMKDVELQSSREVLDELDQIVAQTDVWGVR
jgi:hypothetical protein